MNQNPNPYSLYRARFRLIHADASSPVLGRGVDPHLLLVRNHRGEVVGIVLAELAQLQVLGFEDPRRPGCTLAVTLNVSTLTRTQHAKLEPDELTQVPVD